MQKTQQYKVIQANLQRRRLATDELFIEATRKKADVALIQEPYVGRENCLRDYGGVRIFQNTYKNGRTNKAAIAIFNKDFEVIQHPEFTTNNIVVVEIRTSAWNIVLVSLYFEPDLKMDEYISQLKQIHRRLGPNKLVMGGDVNAKSTWWGSKIEDDRGEQVVNLVNELDLHIINTGDTPTYDTIRGNKRYCSYIDITVCSEDMLQLVDDWQVNEDLISSDHNGITFNIRLTKSSGTNIIRTTRKFNTNKANWLQFHEKMDQLLTENNITEDTIEQISNVQDLNYTINAYTNTIEQTCTHTIPLSKHTKTLTMPWWSESLALLKREVNTRRRRIRNAAPARRRGVIQRYLEHKEKYENEIKIAQTSSWKEFCQKQEKETVWDGIYRVMCKARKREEDLPLEDENGTPLDPVESVKLLARTFYPLDDAAEDNDDHRRTRDLDAKLNAENHNTDAIPFSEHELKIAVKTFNPKKAPGADGFTADICDHAIGCNMKLFLSIINKCLQLQVFPTIWKEATVVILKKPGKSSYTTPKSYRPIGLLPVLGKIYEKMLVARLRYHILPSMSTHQYGFMPQKSAEDALYTLMKHIYDKLSDKRIIAVVSLDIEGAFDSAWWPAIRIRMKEAQCPEYLRRVICNYLSERKVKVRYAGKECVRATNKGCVQGSIAGPILWNLLLDPLLKELETKKVHAQAYADDIVLVFDGNSAAEIEQQANATLKLVREWGICNKLHFAAHKTYAITVTRKLKYDTPRLSMGGIEIVMSKELKILGLTIDDRLTFNTHIANICKKAINRYKILARTAKISWGLHPEVIKIIYTAVVEPTMLYAASAWHPAVKKLGVQKLLNTIQRSFAQKICKGYRTISLNSALILAGILPIDLRVRESALLYETRKGVFQPWLGDREIERMAPFTKAIHPVEQSSPVFCDLNDAEQYTNCNTFDVRIFTDGSRIDGRVGAALSIWRGDTEIKAIKLALSSHCTVFQAELLALNRATKEAKRLNATKIGIFCDSTAALQIVAKSDSRHPLAMEARVTIRDCVNQNKQISLFWIKAHIGLKGNERADELAKEAALLSKKKPDYELCPISFVKRQLRQNTIELWNKRYKECNTAAITKIFLPCAKVAYYTVKKIDVTGITTQLLTGHGGFSEYLNRFGCKEDPSCFCETGESESVVHLITECPMHLVDRLKTEIKMKMNINRENLSIIISDIKMREIFLNFANKIIIKANKRNSQKTMLT